MNKLTPAAVKIQRMGATASNRLIVIMVGITTTTREMVLSIAPIPTVRPPKHPTKVSMIAIQPNRLNSRFLKNSLCSIVAFDIIEKFNLT